MEKSWSIRLLSRNLEPESVLGLSQGSRTHTDIRWELSTLGPQALTGGDLLMGSWWKCEVCEGRWLKLDTGQGMRSLPEVGVFYWLLYLVLEQIWQVLVLTETSCRAPQACQQLSLHGAIPSLGSPWRDFLLGTWGRCGHNHRSPGLSLPCGEETGLAVMTEPVLQDHACWPSWSVEKFLKIPQGHVFILYCFLRNKYFKTLMPEKRALWLLYNWPCCKFKKN